jgi:acetone carboxylase beta subunit
MQYLGQLNDLEIDSPVSELSGAGDWDALVDSFNSTYARVYADAARSPELGYGITGAIMRGSVATKKPNIPEEPDAGPVPSAESQQGTRPFYYEKQWVDAEIFKMELLKPGNEIKGPAVIESDATTYVVPPGFETFLDVNRLFHLIEC